jgi:hypothetical protein
MTDKKKGAGKGMEPIKGYNPKNWYAHFDLIRWDNPIKKEKDNTNDRRTEEISGSNG